MTAEIEAPVATPPASLDIPLPTPTQEAIPEVQRPNDENYFVPPVPPRVDATGRPPHVTWILTEYVEGKKLPKNLKPYEDMLAAAVASTLPMRTQKWRSRDRTRSGENAEDPNNLIKNAANTYLLHFERQKAGLNPDVERVNECLQVLAYWSTELAKLLPALVNYEEALAAFRSNARERVIN